MGLSIYERPIKWNVRGHVQQSMFEVVMNKPNVSAFI